MGIARIPGNLEFDKGLMKVELSACEYDTAFAAVTGLEGVPTTDTDYGRVCIPCGSHNRLSIFFAGTDTSDETFIYKAYGLVAGSADIGSGYVPIKVAVGVVTLGATAVGAYGAFIESATALFADTITETGSNSRSSVYSPGSDEIACLTIDVSGYAFVIIYVTRDSNTAATMDVMYQLFTAVGGGTMDVTDVGTMPVSGTFWQTTQPVSGTFWQTTQPISAAALGAVADAKASVDGNGSIPAHLRRLTTDLDALKTLLANGTNIYTATGKSVTDVEFASIALAGAGTATIHADEAGHHFYLLGLFGAATGSGTFQIREADGSPVYTGAMTAVAASGAVLPHTGFHHAKTASGKGLEIVTVGAGFNGSAAFLDITE